MEVYQTLAEFNKATAEFIVSEAKKTISGNGRFSLVFSGGQTPLGIYSLLAKPYYSSRMQWERIDLFWTDERCVALTDERNNAHQVKVALFDKIQIPQANIHVIPVELPLAAAAYEETLAVFFGRQAPRFDLVLLGVGENGHTASLFPRTNVILEKSSGIRKVYVREEQSFRITMTAPLINQARKVLFLVTGIKKAEILKKVFFSSFQPENYPAQLISPGDGALLLFTDKSAASLLSERQMLS